MALNDVISENHEIGQNQHFRRMFRVLYCFLATFYVHNLHILHIY